MGTALKLPLNLVSYIKLQYNYPGVTKTKYNNPRDLSYYYC